MKDDIAVLKARMAVALADYLGFPAYRTVGLEKSVAQVEGAGWVWNDERLAWVNTQTHTESNMKGGDATQN